MSSPLWLRLGRLCTLALALCSISGCASDRPASRPAESEPQAIDKDTTTGDENVEEITVTSRKREDPADPPLSSQPEPQAQGADVPIEELAQSPRSWRRNVGEERPSGPSLSFDGVFRDEEPNAQAPDRLKVVNDDRVPDMYFEHYGVNPTIDTEEETTSTFSIDVDTASYSLTRAYLERSELVPEAAVRVEEFVNAFDYAYRPPPSDTFSLHAEAFPSPNRPGYHLLHLGVQGRDIEARDRKPANLVFVIDVSGSMDIENRLSLVKQSLRLLVDELRPSDTVGIVVYGTNAQAILQPLGAADRSTILRAIDSIQASGSTNAQAGIELGYRMAADHLLPGGINRVILCSDGVANNGIATGADGIFETVRKQAERGITISTVGFGMGNYNDILMERLAQLGDGNYAYVDRRSEAERLFVQELTQTLQVIAKDVKIQVEFDPRTIARFRLLGYENRHLEREDFDDDRVDAGEVGAGHAVTALYEIKFRDAVEDIGWLRIRFKDPAGGSSELIEKPIPASIVHGPDDPASPPSQLAFVAASFAEKLRGSYWVRTVSYSQLRERHAALPRSLRERDEVRELGALIQQAEQLDHRPDRFANRQSDAEPDFDRVPVLE